MRWDDDDTMVPGPARSWEEAWETIDGQLCDELGPADNPRFRARWRKAINPKRLLADPLTVELCRAHELAPVVVWAYATVISTYSDRFGRAPIGVKKRNVGAKVAELLGRDQPYSPTTIWRCRRVMFAMGLHTENTREAQARWLVEDEWVGGPTLLRLTLPGQTPAQRLKERERDQRAQRVNARRQAARQKAAERVAAARKAHEAYVESLVAREPPRRPERPSAPSRPRPAGLVAARAVLGLDTS